MQVQDDICAALKSYLRQAMLAIALLVGGLADAAATAVGPQSIDDWVATRLREGKPLDFALRCDPKSGDPAVASPAECRKVPGPTIVKLLTGQIATATAWPARGLELSHVLIDGALDLTGAHVTRRIAIRNSEVSGLAILSDSIFDQSLTLECDTFKSGFQGLSLQVKGNLSLQASHFIKEAFLVGLRTGGFLWAGGAAFDDGADFGNAQIGLTFSMSSVGGTFCGGSGPTMVASAPHGFALNAAQTTGNLDLEGNFGHVAGHDAISAHAIRVHGMVGLHVIADGGIDMGHANIDGSLYTGASKLTGTFRAAGSHVGDDVTLSGSTFGDVIDFSDAALGRDFILHGPLRAKGSTSPLVINLQNARIMRLSDQSVSWEGAGVTHCIAGLTYGSLMPRDPKIEPVKDWRRDWLSSDQSQTADFDPQPYQELASVLTRSGDKDGATNVTLWAREQEREMAFGHHWLRYAGLTFMDAFVGYGIGNYIFRALIWAAGITALGAFVLGWSTKAYNNGVLWRLQASLDRLLPIIQLSPEFDDFFRDPTGNDIKNWQVLFFSAVAITGWVLGAFLAAALSGLTQAS